MTKFTVNVRRDENDTGSNKIEVFLDTNPKREIMVLTVRGDSLDMLEHEDEFRPEDEALYYAVERIAQLEATVSEYHKRGNEMQRELTHQRRLNALAMDGNLTLDIVQAKWKGEHDRAESLSQHNAQLRRQYAGAIGLLADLSGHYRLAHSDDREEAIERMGMAADDWCEWSGWSYSIVGHKLSLWPPEPESSDG